jgi:hypothetical protein
MAGPFRTIGSIFGTIDVIASSTSRRLHTWATEQEAKTKYRSVAGTMRVKREAAEELSQELIQLNSSKESQAFNDAWSLLSELDKSSND